MHDSYTQRASAYHGPFSRAAIVAASTTAEGGSPPTLLRPTTEAIYDFFNQSTARATTPGLGTQISNDNDRGHRASALVKLAPESIAEGT